MACLVMPGMQAVLCVDTGPDLAIDVGGKRVAFEWSDRFGPLFTGKRGRVLNNQRQSKRVWQAIQWWFEQGKRVADGVCVWDEVPDPVLVHIIGNIWVEEGNSITVGGVPLAPCKGCERCTQKAQP